MKLFSGVKVGWIEFVSMVFLLVSIAFEFLSMVFKFLFMVFLLVSMVFEFVSMVFEFLSMVFMSIGVSMVVGKVGNWCRISYSMALEMALALR